ncbi:MAG: hypothetical protein K2M94_01310 [Paramuribaculum sp.]|nr:hypothetical protein [Paramuribaculum sp.]
MSLIMIDPVYYSLDFSETALWLLIAMAVITIANALIMWRKLIRVTRKVNSDDEAALPDSGYPAASVIIYSRADGENLTTLLPQILNQDYPAPFEVIVVNDKIDDYTEGVISELELQYSNLYMTFTPDNTRNLSRRKLSLTLGIKAARYNAIIHTQGNCRVNSPLWLRSMMRHFIDGKSVVIGYATNMGPNDTEDCDKNKRRRAFDDVWQSVRYLSAAIKNKAHRGDACNLAYSRDLFFAVKGYSNTLNLTYGDDDLFVNEISTADNTATELSHNGRVDIAHYSPAIHHATERARRDFTAGMLPREPFIIMALSSWLWWVGAAAGIAAAVTGLPSLIPAVTAFAIACIFTIIYIKLWRKCSIALGYRKLRFTIPILAMLRPLRTAIHQLTGRRWHNAHFTNTIH